MSYTALYRKWRPKTFDELKGQDGISTTLKNQVKSGRVAHAYLMCGTRGTGKTSAAKILARAVNCSNPADGNPCNECDICKGILNDSNLNVAEIDAASNRGIDNIRNIIEQVAYPPMIGKYKVFIIDEVHMLSTEAFNALLKTLEEPPDYVIFILATTEVHKLPVTVLSRCQRYDFKRIRAATIVERLREVCASERIDIEEEALFVIAQNADGAFRDALSILDECIAYFQDQRITRDDVVRILGLSDISTYLQMFRCLCHGDLRRALDIVDELVLEGRELGQFINDFLWFLRNMLILHASRGAQDILEMTKENVLQMNEALQGISQDEIMRLIRICSDLSNRMKYSSQKRILLEVEWIKIMTPQMEEENDTVFTRISRVEREILRMQKNPPVIAAVKESEEKKSTAPVKVVKVERANFDEFEMIQAQWGQTIAGLGGADASKFMKTEPLLSDEHIIQIIFHQKILYDMVKEREEYTRLIGEALEKKYHKNFEFQFVYVADKQRGEIIYEDFEGTVLGKIHFPDIEVE